MYTKFEDILRNHILKNPNELNQFLLTEFRNSAFQTYYGFFDSYLVGYGVSSINFCPTYVLSNEDTGYIKFLDKNVFNHSTEYFMHIGRKTACQIAVANKLVDLLSSISLDDLRKFDKEKADLLLL
ncbi:hypothetical protein [Empedobacter sp. GD03797]|uniref:hypothetical protein n=1 Tax=Empedobacter sp. GD03797 TaxID=2975382 RepID=UPI00244C201D|nr:hypothetical protein [Empedobacter sp. GD03797]MDH1883949.1 hypothetical protein [Empedobacter sp. GD03797]